MAKEVRIACPKCDWEPDGGAYWSCTCGHLWNTFDTGGRCPKCSKQWKYTQCIPHHGGCPEWSLHEDWYHGLDEWLEEALEEELQEANLKSEACPPRLGQVGSRRACATTVYPGREVSGKARFQNPGRPPTRILLSGWKNKASEKERSDLSSWVAMKFGI